MSTAIAKDQVDRLVKKKAGRKNGVTRQELIEELGCHEATVSRSAKRLGLRSEVVSGKAGNPLRYFTQEAWDKRKKR